MEVEILNKLEDQRDRLVDTLCQLLRFRTVSGEDKPETRGEFRHALDYLKNLAESLGLSYQELEEKVAWIELQGEQGCIGIPLHLDVMPEGSGWDYGAFEGQVAEGKIWGRGTLDDKGPLVANLLALGIIKEALPRPKKSLRLIIATQEETGDWSDIELYKEKEGEPEFCFVPDAHFPIINAEKGMLTAIVRGKWEQGSEFELSGGERPNMVPDRATITFKHGPSAWQERIKAFAAAHEKVKYELKGNQLVFMGKSAHGSRPYYGHNAVLDALGFLSFLGLDSAPGRFATMGFEGCKDYYGSALGIKAEDSFVGPTTVNLGIARITAEGGEYRLNIRNTRGQSVAAVIEALKQYLEQSSRTYRLSLEQERTGKGMEPLYVDPEQCGEYLKPLGQAFERATGLPLKYMAMGGTTFAKAFKRAVCFGPILIDREPDLCHQPNEHVEIEALVRNLRIYALAQYLLGR